MTQSSFKNDWHLIWAKISTACEGTACVEMWVMKENEWKYMNLKIMIKTKIEMVGFSMCVLFIFIYLLATVRRLKGA